MEEIEAWAWTGHHHKPGIVVVASNGKGQEIGAFRSRLYHPTLSPNLLNLHLQL